MTDLTFSWSHRQEFAEQVDDALRTLRISDWQRALLWLILTHDQSTSAHRGTHLLISLRVASEFLTRTDRFNGLSHRASGRLCGASKRWQERRVLSVSANRRMTSFVLDCEALADWLARERRQLLPPAEQEPVEPASPGRKTSKERDALRELIMENPKATPKHLAEIFNREFREQITYHHWDAVDSAKVRQVKADLRRRPPKALEN